jgi:hypothetical protein
VIPWWANKRSGTATTELDLKTINWVDLAGIVYGPNVRLAIAEVVVLVVVMLLESAKEWIQPMHLCDSISKLSQGETIES